MDTLLKRIRMRTPDSTYTVASACGVTQSTYTRVENGEYNASEEIARRIAIYFGVPVNTIFNVQRYSAVTLTDVEKEAASSPGAEPETAHV